MEEILSSVEKRLWLYMGMVHSGSGLWTWCYSEEGELYYTSCPHEQELKMFFFIGECMDYAMEEGRRLDHPFVMSDSLGLVWAGEYVEMNHEKRLVVTGPVFYASSTMQHIRESLGELKLSVQMSSNCMKILSDVPVMTMTMFTSYINMLHFTITCEDSRNLTVSYQFIEKETANEEGDDDIQEIDYERMNNQEQLILQYVRDGNKNYEEAFQKIKITHTEQMNTGNQKRDMLNIMVIFTSKCAEAAIEGGLSPKIAKAIEWKYIKAAEKQRTVTELTTLNKEMINEFISQVKESRTNYGVSKPIRECCAYIKEHFTEPLTLEKIAKEVGYTEYYLTRKFQKEMGIKLLDYIKETRLEYAKVWLTTTNKTIQEISGQLQFGARNYFSRVFKEKNGITPAEFRERTWCKGKGEEGDETKGRD